MRPLTFKPTAYILLPLFLLLACKTGTSPKNTILTDHDRAMLDSIVMAAYSAAPMPGLAVGLVCGDQVYTKSAGYADMGTKQPLTDTTMFCAGNISEVFTSFMALVLADKYNIKPDEKVSGILPYFTLNSNTYNNISIRHLLTQTSGVPRHSVFWDLPNTSDSALQNTTMSIRLQEPEFPEPGTKVVRSPYNFDIAADVISKASNMVFEDFVSGHVFAPLGMRQSTYRIADILSRPIAKPHNTDNWLSYTFTCRSDYPHNREHLGSIGWNTTLADATIWMEMVLNNGRHENTRFIGQKYIREFLKPQLATDQQGSYMGLGWEIQKKNKVMVFSKAGDVGGFNNAIVLIPAYNMGVIVMSNASGDFNPGIFAQELLFSLKNKTFPKYKPSIHIEMGRVLDSTGSMEKSINFYKQAKEFHYNKYDISAESLSQLGANLFYRLGRIDDALQIFGLCKKEFPESAYGYLNYAEYYLYLKDAPLAENELARAIELTDSSYAQLVHIKTIENALGLLKEKDSYGPGGKPAESKCDTCEDRTYF